MKTILKEFINDCYATEMKLGYRNGILRLIKEYGLINVSYKNNNMTDFVLAVSINLRRVKPNVAITIIRQFLDR